MLRMEQSRMCCPNIRYGTRMVTIVHRIRSRLAVHTTGNGMARILLLCVGLFLEI